MAEILLIEDNPDDAALAMYALKSSSISVPVRHISDGAEALEYVYGEGRYAGRDPADRPIVILLDLKLPRMGGHEILQRLKEDPRSESIPVVLLTSSREDRDLKAAYAAGANSYIVKPVEFEALTEAVQMIGRYWTSFNERPPV